MIKAYLAVIRNSHFKNLWLGQILSQIALNMLSFVLAIRVYRETQSNAAVSFMLLSFAIPSIIFGVVAGGLVDHFDKRKVLVLCNLSRVFLLILFYFFAKNLIAIYAFSIIISIITQFFIPAEGPSIPVLVEETKLLTANSLFTISFYLSTIVGFIMAGPMIRLLGSRNVFLFMSFLMSLATYFVFKLPKNKLAAEKNLFDFSFTFIGKAIDDGIKFIRSNKRVEQSLMLMTFSQALLSTLAVLAPGFADRVLSIELTDASLLVMGPAAVGLVIGAFIIGAYGHRYHKSSFITSGIIAIGINLILLSFVGRGYGIIIAFFFLLTLGIFNSFVNVPANTILQEDSEKAMRGRVYGVLTSATGGVSLLPVVFSGILADELGIGVTLSILGILVTALGVYHYLKRQVLTYTIK